MIVAHIVAHLDLFLEMEGLTQIYANFDQRLCILSSFLDRSMRDGGRTTDAGGLAYDLGVPSVGIRITHVRSAALQLSLSITDTPMRLTPRHYHAASALGRRDEHQNRLHAQLSRAHRAGQRNDRPSVIQDPHSVQIRR